MFFNKTTKYKLRYEPDTDIPSHLLSYVWWVAKRNPVMWTILLITDLIHGVRYPLAFYFVGLTVDAVTNAPTQQVPDEAWFYTAMIFGVLFIGEMAHLITHYWTFEWWKFARAELRSDILAYTLKHSFTFFQNHFAGSLARKVSEGIERAVQLNEQLRWQILLPLVVMGTSSFVLFSMSALYGAFVLAFVIMILLPVFLKSKKLREKSRIYADSCSDVSGQIVDSLTNMASVKSYAHEHQEMIEHTRVSQEQMKAWHKMLRAFLLLDNYRRMTLVIFGAGMMTACVLGWERGLISLGDVAAIMGISFSITAAAWNLSFGFIHVTESLGYLNDTLKTLIKPHAVKDAEDAPVLDVHEGRIHFKDVNFEYASQPVFDALDIEIPPRQRLGLIGPSGSGKSKFINMIQRFYDIQGGTIEIDGQNIQDVAQASLRQNVAVIPQDTALFHRTIMENIRYGRLDASDDEVMAAAEKACAREFIDELQDGFETMVGERGVKLSGGQRQRIAIARAILKDAPILILDEATSALDSESEKQIQNALEHLMDGKTVIAIAHRLSTINHLDRLLVMDNGVIVEDGHHSALLDNDGLYKKLWAMQSGGFLPKS